MRLAGKRAVAESRFTFEPMGGGRFAIRGTLVFSTARAILERSEALFGDARVIKVDLSGLNEADSAGLALLIEWVSWARFAHREIRFFDVPRQIRAIAQISEVEDLLRAGETWTEKA